MFLVPPFQFFVLFRNDIILDHIECLQDLLAVVLLLAIEIEIPLWKAPPPNLSPAIHIFCGPPPPPHELQPCEGR